jgi:hypothetical protein
MDIIRSMPESTSVDFRRKETCFPYRGVPKGVEGGSGDLLFLANHGKIVAAAPILGIDRPNLNDDMDYLEQGSPDDPESYNYIRAGKIYRIENSPPYRGHTGIRYVDRLKDAKLRKFLQKTAKGLRDKLPIK